MRDNPRLPPLGESGLWRYNGSQLFLPDEITPLSCSSREDGRLEGRGKGKRRGNVTSLKAHEMGIKASHQLPRMFINTMNITTDEGGLSPFASLLC